MKSQCPEYELHFLHLISMTLPFRSLELQNLQLFSEEITEWRKKA
jgi:hypothetical protein